MNTHDDGSAPTARASEGGGHHHSDVIVIGAGFAGVTAARELRSQDKRVVVLEARNRIGGRTFSHTFAGQAVEMGGMWVDPETQPHIGAEIKRYGIELVEDVPPERTFFPTPDGPREFTIEDGFGKLDSLRERLLEGSEEYFERPFEPLFRADLLKNVDHLSLRDRLNQLDLTPAEELLINGETSVYSGGSSGNGALTMLAQWWALSGWNAQGWANTMRWRLAPGTRGLITAMLDDANATVRLGSPVVSVTAHRNQVKVATSSGGVYSAAAVVVAVPANVWKTISFAPGLSPAQAAATAQGIGARPAIKLWINGRSPQGRFFAQGAEGGSPISLLIPDKPTDDGHLYVAFSVHPTFDASNRAQVQQAVRQLGADMEVLDVRAYHWSRDRFAGGGWAFRKPGQLTSLYPDVMEPNGRVVFAGGDIARGWTGFMDGAVESGLRAAEQVADLC